jgi:hypothetical protein
MTLSEQIEGRLDDWWNEGTISRLAPRVTKDQIKAIVEHVAHSALVPQSREGATRLLNNLSRDLSKMIGRILDIKFLDPDSDRELGSWGRICWLADFRDAVDHRATVTRARRSGGATPERILRIQKEMAAFQVYQLLTRPDIAIEPTLEDDGAFIMISSVVVNIVTGNEAEMYDTCRRLKKYMEGRDDEGIDRA